MQNLSVKLLEKLQIHCYLLYYNGQWVLSKHKKRSAYETQGGRIEQGETPLECAKRELYEESGIKDATIYPVCDYV